VSGGYVDLDKMTMVDVYSNEEVMIYLTCGGNKQMIGKDAKMVIKYLDSVDKSELYKEKK
jgi:hypothetical protein